MKKPITLISILLSFCFLTEAQDVSLENDQNDSTHESEFIDETPVGLGIRIADEQFFQKRKNTFNAVITPPTIIEQRKNYRGELYFKLYINADEIEVVAKKISFETKGRYKVVEKVSFYHNAKPFTSPNSFERALIRSSETSKNYCVIESNEVQSRENHEYTVMDVQSGKVVSTLRIDYVFPKPVPELFTIDEKWIALNDNRPGDNIFYDPILTNKIFRDQVSAKNLVKTGFNSETNLPDQLSLPSEINTFLIRFRCLMGDGIRETYLEYKMSTDTSWRTTVKKQNPFLILRNIQPGKHKLLVRYPEQDDSVLEYGLRLKKTGRKQRPLKYRQAV